MKRLWEIIKELEHDPLEVVKHARALGLHNEISADEEARLRQALAGYDTLSNKEIRALEDALMSDDICDLIEKRIPLLELLSAPQQETYLRSLSAEVRTAMEKGPLKEKVTPETIYETMMNLGVITTYRSRTAYRPPAATPINLLINDKGIIVQAAKHIMIKSFEGMPLECAGDFDKAEQRLQATYQQIVQQVNNGTR